jgi:hypothetical protein
VQGGHGGMTLNLSEGVNVINVSCVML